jgi:hypothetical protein
VIHHQIVCITHVRTTTTDTETSPNEDTDRLRDPRSSRHAGQDHCRSTQRHSSPRWGNPSNNSNSNSRSTHNEQPRQSSSRDHGRSTPRTTTQGGTCYTRTPPTNVNHPRDTEDINIGEHDSHEDTYEAELLRHY